MRLEDAIDNELQRGDAIEDYVSTPSASCLLCSEALLTPTFDCGHAVCSPCTTGMLSARHKDASFVMPCPRSVYGCQGKYSFLQTLRQGSDFYDDMNTGTTTSSAASSASSAFASPAATAGKTKAEAETTANEPPIDLWKHYAVTAENAMLREVGMFPCPSAACSIKASVIFIPFGSVHPNSWDTECGNCGLHICSRCTHLAGKVVVFHAPLPCDRRVELHHTISTLKTDIEQDRRARQQVIRQMHEEMQMHGRLHLPHREYMMIDEEMRMHDEGEEMMLRDHLPHRLGVDHLHLQHLEDPKLREYAEVLCAGSWHVSIDARMHASMHAAILLTHTQLIHVSYLNACAYVCVICDWLYIYIHIYMCK